MEDQRQRGRGGRGFASRENCRVEATSPCFTACPGSEGSSPVRQLGDPTRPQLVNHQVRLGEGDQRPRGSRETCKLHSLALPCFVHWS